MKKKVLLIVIVFSILFSITSIIIGLYINGLSKPKNVLSKGISFIHDEGKKYVFIDNNLDIGDTYTITSSLDFNLDSKYYLREGSSDPEVLKKYNFIKNISKMDTNIVLKQDKSNKTNYLELNQKIDNEDIVSYKRLVSNSTEYYFINGILSNYVNNGTCNYFESLTDENTTRSNIEYLYDFIFESLKNNMKDNYFESYEVEENIDSKNTKVHKISITFTDKNVREILNNILKDLKKDEKANNILSNIDSKFKDYKVKDKVDFFDKDESYTLNVYTTKALYKPLKYEVIHLNSDNKESYIIECNNNSYKYYYLENDDILYTADIKVLDDGISGKIYDTSSKEIGEMLLEKKNHNIVINYNFDNSIDKINFKYSSMYDKVKNKKSYTNKRKLDIKYLVNKESKIEGSIELISKVENKADIDVDVKGAILYAKLSDEKKNLIKNKREDIKTRLER